MIKLEPTQPTEIAISTVQKANEEVSTNLDTATKGEEMRVLYNPMFLFFTEKETELKTLLDEDLTKDVYKKIYTIRQELKTKRVESLKNLKPFEESAKRSLKATKSVGETIRFLSLDLEDKAQKKEDEFNTLEQQKKDAIEKDRADQLKSVGVAVPPSDLQKLSKVDWLNLLSNEKTRIETEKETKRIADEEKAETERKAQEEKERLEAENKKLKAEAAEQKAITEAKIQQERKEKEEAQKELNAFKKEKERVRLEKEAEEFAIETAKKLKEQEIKDKANKEAQGLKDIEDLKEANKIKEADQAERKLNQVKFDVLISTINIAIELATVDHIDYLDKVANIKGIIALNTKELESKINN